MEQYTCSTMEKTMRDLTIYITRHITEKTEKQVLSGNKSYREFNQVTEQTARNCNEPYHTKRDVTGQNSIQQDIEWNRRQRHLEKTDNNGTNSGEPIDRTTTG